MFTTKRCEQEALDIIPKSKIKSSNKYNQRKQMQQTLTGLLYTKAVIHAGTNIFVKQKRILSRNNKIRKRVPHRVQHGVSIITELDYWKGLLEWITGLTTKIIFMAYKKISL